MEVAGEASPLPASARRAAGTGARRRAACAGGVSVGGSESEGWVERCGPCSLQAGMQGAVLPGVGEGCVSWSLGLRINKV